MPTLTKPPKSDLHAPPNRPINLAQKAHRLGKIASAQMYSEQHNPPKGAKSSIAPKSIVSKQPGLVREESRQVMGNFDHGGKVRKSGVYRLKKGETVKRARKSSSKRA